MTSSSSCNTRFMCTPDATCDQKNREQRLGPWEASGLTRPHTHPPTHPNQPTIRLSTPMAGSGTRPRWATRRVRSRSSVSKTEGGRLTVVGVEKYHFTLR
ncbi:hypothetical protein E2C01_026852 [Portunus trituberculatus]|uniref:Uncharacterized protein n=1 Tax=Portunus trituberculatus TaxID=210409 RepID=A0A5B7EGD7_PORTR|nr:hypothetical protein [Portunus trituberculatus]